MVFKSIKLWCTFGNYRSPEFCKSQNYFYSEIDFLLFVKIKLYKNNSNWQIPKKTLHNKKWLTVLNKSVFFYGRRCLYGLPAVLNSKIEVWLSSAQRLIKTSTQAPLYCIETPSHWYVWQAFILYRGCSFFVTLIYMMYYMYKQSEKRSLASFEKLCWKSS